jgi:hypothetical protein
MSTPQFRVQIVKSKAGEQWSNDYLTDDTTLLDAQDLAATLLTWEKHIHDTATNFDYINVSNLDPTTRIFRHLTLNEPGLLSAGDSLPLFNTMRVDFGTANSDPGRKYYRCPIGEGNQVNGFLTGDFITAINALIVTYLVTPAVLGHIVTNAGNTVVDATVHSAVQMRQLHRRRRKKVVLP